MIPVLISNGIAPDQRRRADVAHSASIADIVAAQYPGAPEALLNRLRVTMVRRDAATGASYLQTVPRLYWPHVRPHAGIWVHIRLVEGDPISIGSAVSSWIGGAYYAATGLSLGGLALNAILIGTAVAATVGISLLMNALVPPPPQPDNSQPDARYRISGWRNQLVVDQPIPLALGRIRVAPPYVVQPYSEIVGDFQFIRAGFLVGYGRVRISDPRLGDTSTDDFASLTLGVYEGRADDPAMQMLRDTRFEESPNVQLRGPQAPTDADGNEIDGEAEEQDHTYTLAARSSAFAVIFHWPQGLTRINKDQDLEWRTVAIRVDRRRKGETEWVEVETFEVGARQREAFFRQRTWALPDRNGTWEVRVTRLSVEDERTNRIDAFSLVAVQSIRPEYGVNFHKPLALVEAKARASFELNGTIDTFNVLAERYVPVFDPETETWAEGISSNCASQLVFVLQGNSEGCPHPFPVPDDGINWDQLADFWEHCDLHGLTFDGEIRSDMALRDLLAMIAGAGRAQIRHDGARWGVIIDRVQDVIADHIGPRNSKGFTWARTWAETPDAVRVKFQDATDDFADAEIIVRWPKFDEAGNLIDNEAPVLLTEEWERPGITDPMLLTREVFRDMLVAHFRRDTFTVMQEGPVRAATRGDTVMLSHYALSDTQRQARVASVTGNRIVLDELVEMDAGGTYVVQWQTYTSEDKVGGAIQSGVATVAGETRALTLTGSAAPTTGTMIIFGPAEDVAERCQVLDVESATDGWVRLTLTNAAEEIDALLDTYTPEPWSPVVGYILPPAAGQFAPVFRGVETAADPDLYGAADRILRVTVAASPDDLTPAASLQLEHRLAGAADWTVVVISGTSGTVDIPGYSLGDEVERRAVALDLDGTPGAYTGVLSFVVGSDETDTAVTPDIESAVATGGLGMATLNLAGVATGAEIRIFRTPVGETVDTAADLIDTVTAPGGALTYFDGDPSRMDLVDGGDMADAASWAVDAGWSFSGGAATHTAGTVDSLSQQFAAQDGAVYRFSVEVSGRTAGSITVQLTGGTTVASAPIWADGLAQFALPAVAGNDTLEIVASADFDGTVERVIAYLQTPASSPQGAVAYRFASVSVAGVPSALSGAVITTIS